MSGVGSSPALATCKTRDVLLAGVPGGFSWGSPVFAHLLIGLSDMCRNNLERDIKLNLKKKKKKEERKKGFVLFRCIFGYQFIVHVHV